ncbi:MAG TPA: hypothetical protein VGF90_03290 [Verrucomicrobiae bacterium]
MAQEKGGHEKAEVLLLKEILQELKEQNKKQTLILKTVTDQQAVLGDIKKAAKDAAKSADSAAAAAKEVSGKLDKLAVMLSGKLDAILSAGNANAVKLGNALATISGQLATIIGLLEPVAPVAVRFVAEVGEESFDVVQPISYKEN